METLVKARPLLLATFFLALAAIGIGTFIDAQALFRNSAALAHFALFLFILTESFGSVSRRRSFGTRIIARIFLFLSAFVVIGLLVNYFIVLIGYE